MKPVRPTLTYLGIAVAAAGFVVILITWGEVGALTAVPLQMPYLLSGGLVGLGLIMTGLTLISVNAKRMDAAARERQLGQVREVLSEIKLLLAGDATPTETETPPTADTETALQPDTETPAKADPTEPIPPVKV